MSRNFVIAGGLRDNPAKLSMAIEPIKLDEKAGIAVKSVAYGELQNVNKDNNTNIIILQFDGMAMVNDIMTGDYKSKSAIHGERTVIIEPGFYLERQDVVDAIVNACNGFLKDIKYAGDRFSKLKRGKTCQIFLPKYITFQNTPLLSMIEAEEVSSNEWNVYDINEKVTEKQMMGCFYLNIVENSFINGRKSRILCICPFQFRPGYSFYEFQNPTYVPIEVKEFSNISLSILDFNGKFMSFSNKFDTVVTLEMRPLYYK